MILNNNKITAQQKLFLIIGSFTLLRIIVSIFVEPGFDEAYYGMYSYHLSAGYFDHPPLVAVSAGLGRFLTGVSNSLTLRIGAIVIFVFTSLSVYKLAEKIFNKKTGIISVILLNIIPYFCVGLGAFVIPDNFLGLFWVGSLLVLYQIRKTDKSKYFYFLGVMGGLALLSKYHAVLLIFAIFLSFLIDDKFRKWMKTPYPYVSFIIAILIFIPNLLWNYQHNWVSYIYQFGKSASGFDFSFLKFFRGIMVQMGYLLPWHMGILVAGTIWVWKKGKEYSWLLPQIIVPILIFTIIGGTRQILPHWPMPGYLVAIIASAAMIGEWKDKISKRYLFSTGIFTIILVLFVTIQAEFGIISLNQKSDVTLDGQGWKKLAQHLEQKNYINKNRFLFTHKWFLSGELAFAVKNRYPVTVINDSPHAFYYWVDDITITGKDGIYIGTNRYKTEVNEKYSIYFKQITAIDTLKTARYGNKAKTFYIWLCEDYNGQFKYPYGNKR